VASAAATGGTAAGHAAVGGGSPGDPILMNWFKGKVNDYRACRIDFEDAGLLVPDSAGAAYGIVDKFSMTDKVLGMMCQVDPGMMSQPKAKRRLHHAPSRSLDADITAGPQYTA
jgi:hypothetical protein